MTAASDDNVKYISGIQSLHINNFSYVDVVGLCRFEDYVDEAETIASPYPQISLEDLQKCEFDEILISSFQYQFEIVDYLEAKGILKPVVHIYDSTSSRNFIYTFSQAREFRFRSENG